MKRLIGAAVLAALSGTFANSARADEKEAQAVVDKAITALGGADKLAKMKMFSIKIKGTITLNGDDNPFTAEGTYQGLDHHRSTFEGEFGGNKFVGVTVVAGDNGWRKFGDNAMEIDADGLANEKRNLYRQLIPAMMLPLKEKGFKVETAGEEVVGTKTAAVLKVTGPDGKDFKLFCDKDSGLPVKVIAQTVGFDGNEFTQEATFSDYKDFEGIKRATKVELKRDGEKFVSQEITEFKTLDKVDPETFAEPK